MFLDIDSAGWRQAIRLHSLISRGMHLGPALHTVKRAQYLGFYGLQASVMILAVGTRRRMCRTDLMLAWKGFSN